ncbi:hypothetical protein [Deinococcus pimensis]|uniref:hypothetical protein n=1 Tax=Deinococcus pimensis TaxID=309888 RepID=UPI0004856D04|nr:hypothetical protein [Deinococcus pimensis]
MSGAAANSTVTIDGGGGGGGGGSVLLQVNVTSSVAGLVVRADGGKGGDNRPATGGAHGPGGGGGGGFVVTTGAVSASSSVAGGLNGTTERNGALDAWGASPGSGGTISVTSSLTVSGTPAGFSCTSSTLTLQKTVTNLTRGAAAVTSNTALPGDVLRYVVTFSVSGSLDVTGATFSDLVNLSWVTPSGSATLLCPLRSGQSSPTTAAFAPSGGVYAVDVVGTCGPLSPGMSGSVRFDVTVR